MFEVWRVLPPLPNLEKTKMCKTKWKNEQPQIVVKKNKKHTHNLCIQVLSKRDAVTLVLSSWSCRVGRLSGHPRPSSVEALVYRGCPDKAPTLLWLLWCALVTVFVFVVVVVFHVHVQLRILTKKQMYQSSTMREPKRWWRPKPRKCVWSRTDIPLE